MGSPSQAEKSELTCGGDAARGPPARLLGESRSQPQPGEEGAGGRREEAADTALGGAAASLALPSPPLPTEASLRSPVEPGLLSGVPKQSQAITGPRGASFAHPTSVIYLLLGHWAGCWGKWGGTTPSLCLRQEGTQDWKLRRLGASGQSRGAVQTGRRGKPGAHHGPPRGPPARHRGSLALVSFRPRRPPAPKWARPFALRI